MSKAYASGKHAFGFCDRCSFRYPLADLKFEVQDGHLNGLRVCEKCKDIDHEQLQLGEFRIWDPEALQDPRPDLAEDTGRSFFGWAPVGDNIALEGTGQVGTVTISTP